MQCAYARVNVYVVCVHSGRICARERVNVYVRVIVCACIGTRVCLLVGVSVKVLRFSCADRPSRTFYPLYFCFLYISKGFEVAAPRKVSSVYNARGARLLVSP